MSASKKAPVAQRLKDSLRAMSRRSSGLRFALTPAIAANRFFVRRRRSIQQECYERLRDRLIEDPVLAIEECDGQFAMDVRSDVFKRIFFRGAYEPSLMQLCRELVDPQRDAIDVGANIGFFTVLMAKRLAAGGRRVLAVEPTPNALRRLKANIERNGVAPQVSVFEGVASNAPGVVEITVVVGKEEYSSLSGARHPRITGEEGVEFAIEKQPCQAATIDELTTAHRLNPGFLKVDVEGAELLVFQGAHKTLAEYRPIVLSEISAKLLSPTGTSASNIVDIFKSLDYAVLDPATPDLSTPATFLEEEMLCIPREKLAAYDAILKSR